MTPEAQDDKATEVNIIPAPPPFGFLKLPAGSELSDIEDTIKPFYVQTRHGWYAAKSGLYARSIVPIEGEPPGYISELADLKEKRGHIVLTGVRFPMWLVLQAKDFFTRIYDNHKTEAEICVTYHWETKQFRAFVPEQYTSHGGVHYRFDPKHIKSGWAMVGTIHSHCNFSAFHSGTDTHDADHQDGMHMTIGQLKGQVQFAQMLSIGPTRIDLDFDEAVDNTQTEGPTTAPKWWDRYVHNTGTAPWMKSKTVIQFNGQGRMWNDADGDWQNTSYYQTPNNCRSVYDTYSQMGDDKYARRYILPTNWTAHDGSRFVTPVTLPIKYRFWHEWILDMGIDPRTYIFDEVNFPDWFNIKNPERKPHRLSLEALEAAAAKFGNVRTPYRMAMGLDAVDQPQTPKDKEFHYESTDTETYEGWWDYILSQQEQGHNIQEIQKELQDFGITVDSKKKTVTFSGASAKEMMEAEQEDKEQTESDDFIIISDALIKIVAHANKAGLKLDWSLTQKTH